MRESCIQRLDGRRVVAFTEQFLVRAPGRHISRERKYIIHGPVSLSYNQCSVVGRAGTYSVSCWRSLSSCPDISSGVFEQALATASTISLARIAIWRVASFVV